MTTYGGPYQSGFAGSTPVAPPSAPVKSPLPVISLLISALARIGVIGLGVAMLVAGAFNVGGNGDAPLTGQLSSLTAGSLRGDALVQDLTGVIGNDGVMFPTFAVLIRRPSDKVSSRSVTARSAVAPGPSRSSSKMIKDVSQLCPCD